MLKTFGKAWVPVSKLKDKRKQTKLHAIPVVDDLNMRNTEFLAYICQPKVEYTKKDVRINPEICKLMYVICDANEMCTLNYIPTKEDSSDKYINYE